MRHLLAQWRKAIHLSHGGVLEWVPTQTVIKTYKFFDAMSGTWEDIRDENLADAKSGSAQFSSWGLDPGEPSLYESIRDEGFWEAIHVYEYPNGERWVVDGHTRLAVAEDLGLPQVPIEVVQESQRVGSMGPYPPLPEVLEPPLYRSNMSPGQRVIISHPEMEVEVEGTITGEIPTTGIMVIRLEGVDGVVHVPLSMIRAAAREKCPGSGQPVVELSNGYPGCSVCGKEFSGQGKKYRNRPNPWLHGAPDHFRVTESRSAVSLSHGTGDPEDRGRSGRRKVGGESGSVRSVRSGGDLHGRGPGADRRRVVGAGQVTVSVPPDVVAQYRKLQANQRKVVLGLVKDIQKNGFPASAKAQTGPLKGHVRVRFSGMGGAEWRLIFKQEGGGHYTLIYVGPREGVYGSRKTASLPDQALALIPASDRSLVADIEFKDGNDASTKWGPMWFSDSERAIYYYPDSGMGSSQVGGMVHELGHAIDHALGWISHTPQFKAVADQYPDFVGKGVAVHGRGRASSYEEAWARGYAALYGGVTPFTWPGNDSDLALVIRNARIPSSSLGSKTAFVIEHQEGPFGVTDIWVAREGDKIIGALEVWRGIATKVYVDPDYRRRGIAKALWDASGATSVDDQLSPSGAEWAGAMLGKEVYPTWGSEGEWGGWLENLKTAGFRTGSGIFWRIHPKNRPFEVGGGSSQIHFTDEERATLTLPEPLTRIVEGYSAFHDPGHLWQYAVEMGWADEDGFWEGDPVEVIGFEGKIVGSGYDGEPTVRPTAQPFARMSWDEFNRQVEPWAMGPWYEGINMPIEAKTASALDEVRLEYENHVPDEYGSWACFDVAPAIQRRWGFPAVEGFYAPEGDVNKALDTERLYTHWWNILPDGRILDATAGQWRRGGGNVEVVAGSDPRYIEWKDVPADRRGEALDLTSWSHFTGKTAMVGTIYEKVSFEDQGRTRTVYLRNPNEGDLVLSGIEVNKEGDEISGKGFDDRLRVIDLSLIKSRIPMVMNNTYGELEPKEAATWRGFSGDKPFWTEHDVVIATQRRGRDRYFETWVGGRNYGNFPRLEEAKAAIASKYGNLEWVQVSMPKQWVEHYYFGWTDEFTDPLTLYYADF